MSYNHRVSIFTTPTQSIEYLYNAQNQRVAKKVNGTIVEKYLWSDLTTLLAVYDKDDNLIQRFEYSDGRMPTSMTYGGVKYYLHYDQVGSLRAVSDTMGNIVKEITYDTYGNILYDTNPTFKVPFGFAGGLLDKDTGLTRFGYRDYDSDTGKWTAKDPIDFAGGDTNLYGYVLGDPVNFVDVDGLWAVPVAGVCLTAWGVYQTAKHLDELIENKEKERQKQQQCYDYASNNDVENFAKCTKEHRENELKKTLDSARNVGKDATGQVARSYDAGSKTGNTILDFLAELFGG